MARLTKETLPQVLARLERIQPGTQPRWGKMNVAQLFGHLTQVVGYTMQTDIQFPFKGNWKTRWIFRPLILSGAVKIPKNVRLPKPPGADERPPPPEGTLDDLREVLGNYVASQESGGLPAAVRHPFFGDFSPKDWSRFHWRHLDHHCRQFGA